jgi:adenylyltransferase/sulfurtransferase
MSNPPWIITAAELRRELKSATPPKVLDVREPEGHEESRIEGDILIPLGDLEARAGELNKNDDIVAYCAAGMRSLHAVMVLKKLGFEKVRSLDGGMYAWDEESG